MGDTDAQYRSYNTQFLDLLENLQVFDLCHDDRIDRVEK